MTEQIQQQAGKQDKEGNGEKKKEMLPTAAAGTSKAVKSASPVAAGKDSKQYPKKNTSNSSSASKQELVYPKKPISNKEVSGPNGFRGGRGRGRGRGTGRGAAVGSARGPSSASTRGRGGPVRRGRKESEKSEAKGEASSDSSDGEEDGDNSRSPSPPPSVPLTFWTPVVFLCPMPNCPPDTEPTTNPTVALDHLKTVHNMEVKNPHHLLPYLDKYIEHWATIVAETGTQGIPKCVKDGVEVLCLGHEEDADDKTFRAKLQKDKLTEMLKIQERERLEDSTVPLKCLFCKVISPERTTLFRHMFSEHGFNIGLPDNLVEVSTFLSTLSQKLANLQCLYCEKIFKTSAVLRKHMRKKKHFKINPRNRGYDRFYVINYLEPGKNWESFENERDGGGGWGDGSEEEEEWGDWSEEDAGESQTMCLFDETVYSNAEECVNHMRAAHAFDLCQIRQDRQLDFYASIRLVNYIRKQTSLCTCFACSETFDTFVELTAHLDSSGHCSQIPNTEHPLWNDPQYLFPCYEDDPLLMFDVDNEEEDEGKSRSEEAKAEEYEALKKVVEEERRKAEQREQTAVQEKERAQKEKLLEQEEHEEHGEDEDEGSGDDGDDLLVVGVNEAGATVSKSFASVAKAGMAVTDEETTSKPTEKGTNEEAVESTAEASECS